MIDISSFMDLFLQGLDELFSDRVWFVGLQGSYGRGEATAHSDIDMVVVLDELTADDIKVYNDFLDTLPHRELLCGFLSGKRELLNWEPADLFQFYYDTTPVRGSLDELLTVIDETAVKRAVKAGACNICHGCVHNMLYEKSDELLKGLYKAASFTVQAIAFLQTGEYFKHLNDLLTVVSEDEKQIIGTFLALKNGAEIDFDAMSRSLYNWASAWIAKE